MQPQILFLFAATDSDEAPRAILASRSRNGAYLAVETEMKLIIFSALAAAAAAQTPDVQTIMENVGRNQAQTVALRQEFTFHQRQLLKMNRGNGKVAREEHREYDITPNGLGVRKELIRFEGKYE